MRWRDCTLAEEEFDHAGHVRAAYLYLQSGDFVESLERMRRAIRNYAGSLGNPDRYHETITVAYVALIQQVLYERGHGSSWSGVRARCAGIIRTRLAAEILFSSRVGIGTCATNIRAAR